MGTYTDFIVANDYTLITSKSRVVSELLTVFRESDRLNIEAMEDDEDSYRPGFHGYVTSGAVVAKRLDIMGFCLESCRQTYEKIRQLQIDYYKDERAKYGPDCEPYDLEKLELLEKLDFDTYVAGLRDVIINRRVRFHNKIIDISGNWIDDETRTGNVILEYILNDEEYEFGFFCSDIRYLIRVVLSIDECYCSPVVQDITGLVNGGYHDQDEQVCQAEIDALVKSYPKNAPIIILAEGKTDIAILSRALKLLYPEYEGYYKFFDFFSVNGIAGGASQLVGILKAFIASGITNRVVAIFDNDTPATEVISSINRSSLPANIRILQYPDIHLLKAYPTLGPAGPSTLNVNGKAGSIELYLGQKNLMGKNGELHPVVWQGYSQKFNQYHGVVMDKDGIYKRWQLYADQSESDNIYDENWNDLKSILESIFDAFINKNNATN